MIYNYKKIIFIIATLSCTGISYLFLWKKLYSYYSPANERSIYYTRKHKNDTLRIAYIGDSWAYGHKYHTCQLATIIENCLHCPVTIESYGIGGLTSKEIYHALFEIDNFKRFIEKGYDYCYISAGINDANKKMSSLYYKESMDCIIRFMIANHIHPLIQEIPDYNIQRAFERQTTKKKLIRRVSMVVNGTKLDCKQQFRDALDELIKAKEYQNKVTVIRYKSWNNNYEKDLRELYIEDQMHLNDKGYAVLDSVIANEIINRFQNYN